MLVVAHDDDLRRLISVFVRRDPRLRLLDDAATTDEALDRVTALRPDLVVLDDGIGYAAGIDLAEDLVAAAPLARILLLVAPYSTRTVPTLAVDGVLAKHELRSLTATIARMLELGPLADE